MSSKDTIYVLYGSATGNAEHIAKELAATRSGDKVETICAPLQDFKKFQKIWSSPPENGKSKHLLWIIVSTTGNGDAPENASRFVRFIKRKSTSPTIFQHVAYSILGLGDTNYSNFCATGKIVDQQLIKVGASRIQPLACADEATGLEDVVEPWMESILPNTLAFIKYNNIINNNDDDDAGNNEDQSSKDQPVKPDNDAPNAPTPPKPPVTEIKEKVEEEEKKQVDAPPAATASSCTAGAAVIQTLLSTSCQQQQSKESTSPVPPTTIPSVHDSSLPCHAASATRTKACHILPPQEKSTTTTTNQTHSKDAIHDWNHPFSSQIVNARYLTLQTSTLAAQQVTQKLMMPSSLNNDDAPPLDLTQQLQAMDIYNTAFPLDEKEQNSKRVVELELTLPTQSQTKWNINYDKLQAMYQPGDAIGILVPNPPSSVQYMLDLLKQHAGLDPTQTIELQQQQDDASSTQTILTLQQLLQEHLDLSSTVETLSCRSFQTMLYLLSTCATDPQERMALRYLACKQRSNATTSAVQQEQQISVWNAYMIQGKRTIVDVIQDFPSCHAQLSPSFLIHLLPRLLPRYFSIASSPLVHETTLKIAFSVVDYQVERHHYNNATTTRRIARKGGVATRYLEMLASPFLASTDDNDNSLPQKLPLCIFLKQCESTSSLDDAATFTLPKDVDTPLILIGPGTGIAPFIGFLEHRQAQLQQQQQSTPPIHVYFGCRYQDHDFLYQRELTSWATSNEESSTNKNPLISQLCVAISRKSMPDNDKNKSIAFGGPHVQHIMQQQQDNNALAELIIKQGASIYICGDAKAMARDVQHELTNVLSRYLTDLAKAKEYIEEMKVKNRFLLDLWS